MKRSTVQTFGTDMQMAAPAGGRNAGYWRLAPLAFAISLHVAALAYFVKFAGPDAGALAGEPDATAVEVIDEAAFQDQFPSAVAAKPAPPPTAPTAQAAPSPPSPQPASVQPAATAEASPAATSTKAPVAPPDPLGLLTQVPLSAPQSAIQPLDLAVPKTALVAPKTKPMTAAQFVNKQLGGSAKERYGEIDAFTREVGRELEQAKPVSHGISGDVVVSFVVSPEGAVENLDLVSSSGDTRLDRLILTTVRGLHVRVPPATADPRDRTFEITFRYR